MAIWVPWLADAARMTGYPVIEVGGWRGRGHGGMRVVEGVVPHHTADGPTGDYPSLRIVRDGRAGLAGPLSQLGLGRTGRIFVIAAGQSWHAGASAWAGFWDLNDEFVGIEAESVGTRNDWTPEQRDCYPRLVAALLHFMRRDAGRCGAHKEVCRPHDRKIDPAYWHMDGMRGRVGRYLANPPSINRHWRPEEEFDMDEQRLREIIREEVMDLQVENKGATVFEGRPFSLRRALEYFQAFHEVTRADVRQRIDTLETTLTAEEGETPKA
jgi:hypothetical protein